LCKKILIHPIEQFLCLQNRKNINHLNALILFDLFVISFGGALSICSNLFKKLVFLFNFVLAQEIIKVSAPSEDEEKINRRARRDRGERRVPPPIKDGPILAV
jgi:hypothetical protein